MESTYNGEGLKGPAWTIAGTAIAGVAKEVLGNGFFGGGCGNNAYVNRYEAEQSAKIAALEADIKLRDANTYTMTKLGELRDYVDAKFDKVEARLCKQGEYNVAQTSALNCIQGQIAQLMSLTKLVVPNGSVCPGWGNVEVSIPASAA